MARDPSVTAPTTVGELLSRSPTLRARTAHISLNDWRRAVGDRLASRTQPERLLDGVLTVRVPSSTWAQELSLLSETVHERLVTAGHRVRRLRFRVASRPPSPSSPVTAVRRAALPADLSARLQQIEDPELRHAIARAASYSLGRRRPK